MITIKEYISNIYDDFKEYIDESNCLCKLKTLNFQAGQTPDYSDIHIQQLYLLRYTFSYAFEYKSMYRELLAREDFQDCIDVISVGCGNMIDYWGLIEALGESDCSSLRIKYKGIDNIDWNYQIKAREEDEIEFRIANAGDVLKNADNLPFDIFIFPKSISEFSNEEFQDVCGAFEQKSFNKYKIHILISLRADEGSMDRDIERSDKIVAAMKHNGYIMQDEPAGYIHFKEENKGINGFDKKFVYPNRAKHLLNSLNEQCKSLEHCSQNCMQECQKYLNRWPVLKVKSIKFQILTFRRDDLI